MAVILGGVSKCRPVFDKTTHCCGQTFLSRKVGGSSSLRISVWTCSYSNNDNASVHSNNENAGQKLTKRRREDALFPSHIDERRAMRWCLPLFGWSQAEQERWADYEINESKTKSKVMDKSSDDGEEEMEEVQPRRSKFVRGRLTSEKAKILRKNLRDTSTRRDVMYHSAIAARLASPDSEGLG